MENKFSFKRLGSYTKFMLRQNFAPIAVFELLNLLVMGFWWVLAVSGHDLNPAFNVFEDTSIEKLLSTDYTLSASLAIGSIHFFNIFATFFFTIKIFSFLYSKRKIDFFHACPVTRTEYFLSFVLSSAVLNTVLVMTQLGALFFAFKNHAFDVSVIFLAALLSIVSGMIFAAVTALCAVCEGTVVNFLISFTNFAVMGSICIFCFLHSLTLIIPDYVSTTVLPEAFIPQYFIQRDTLNAADISAVIGLRIILLVIFTALGIHFYSRRKSEKSGDMRPSFLTVIFLPLNIFCFFTFINPIIQIYYSYFPFTRMDLPLLHYVPFFSYPILASVVVLAVLIALLIKSKAGKKNIIISSCVCAFLIALTAASCTLVEKNADKINNYVPETEKIESVKVIARIPQYSPERISRKNCEVTFTDKEMIETAAALHRRIGKVYQFKLEKNNIIDDLYTIEYRLKNGLTVKRRIPTVYCDDATYMLLEKIINDEQFTFFGQNSDKKPSVILVKKSSFDIAPTVLKGQEADELYGVLYDDRKDGASTFVSTEYDYVIDFIYAENGASEHKLEGITGRQLSEMDYDGYYLRKETYSIDGSFKKTLSLIENKKQ